MTHGFNSITCSPYSGHHDDDDDDDDEDDDGSECTML